MIVVVMGVSGCGKSSVAEQIAKQLGVDFLDADDLHPAENKKLMSSGIALTDENRLPWLRLVRDTAQLKLAEGASCIIACSALKKRYRIILNEVPAIAYVFLDGCRSLIQQRLHQRSGHFMPESLLDSQFAALESPIDETNVVTVPIDNTVDQVASAAIDALRRAHVL